MGWLLLFVAVIVEVRGTTSMKLSHGFTRPVPSVLLFVFYACSFVALTFALQRIELSVAYAIWSAVGTAIVAVIGVYLFSEYFNWIKAVSLLLIVLGVVGLHSQSDASPATTAVSQESQDQNNYQ